MPSDISEHGLEFLVVVPGDILPVLAHFLCRVLRLLCNDVYGP